ncbi:MAG: 8-oxo-dGTP diphosphatase [SAR324 cluster bacterium]|nr:8-oxo-dGTP diphosphatase [SAR324 cluster bacterium]
MKLGVLVYIEQANKVLMIHREKDDEHQGFWLAPGGKLEKNEAPAETAIREVREETGLKIEALELKAVLSFPDDGDSPFGDEWQVFVFHSALFSGELTGNCPEGRLAWIPRDQLTDLPMWAGDKLFTPKVFKKGCFLGKIHYKRDVLIETKFWN